MSEADVEGPKQSLSESAVVPSTSRPFPWRTIAWGAAELSVIALLLSVVFLQRLLELERIEIGGDALKVWEFARNFVLGGDWPESLNHHTSRFGLVLPTMVAQLFLGVDATTYFVAPLVSSVLLHLWVYLIGRKLSGPIAGTVGVLALLGFEPMTRASSQILPESFGPMYTAFAIYGSLVYSEAKTLTGRWCSLLAVGVGIVFAYGSKMSYLYYAPGIAFLVWFGGAKGGLLPLKYATLQSPGEGASFVVCLVHRVRKSKLLVPGILTLVVVGLVLIESVFLSNVTGAGNRLEVVQGSHGGAGARGPRIHEVGDFFALYTRAPAVWIQAMTAGAVAWIGLSAFGRDKRSKLVGLALFIYVFLQTFVVRRLDPLTPWMEPHPRYLLAMAGPLAVVLGLFIGDAISVLVAGKSVGSVPGEKGRGLALFTAAALFVLVGSGLLERYESEWEKKSAWRKTENSSVLLTKAFDAGLPIVAETPKGKPAWAAAALFINHRSILDAEGKPRPSAAFMRKYVKRGRYVARALATLKVSKKRIDNVVRRRATKRKCAIVLRQSSRFISGRITFGKKCQSLEEEFKTNPQAGKRAPKSKRKNRRGSRDSNPSSGPSRLVEPKRTPSPKMGPE